MFHKSFSSIRPSPVSGATDLSTDPIERLADLIAQGRADLPEDLEELDRERLVVAVRRQLRNRMRLHICQALAIDLEGQKPSRTELDSDD